MTDMIDSSHQTPDTAQAPASREHGQEQATSPLATEEALAANIIDAAKTTLPIDLDPNTPAGPAAPVEPAVPAGQPGQPGQPVPEEEELDELIIEDFTIDGICGVY